MPRAICAKCRQWFDRNEDESWKKLCLDCYLDKKATDNQHLSTIDYLHNKLSTMSDQLAESQRLVSLVQDNLKFLIMACHPDRNPGNVEAANLITKNLLDIKQTLKRQNDHQG